MRGIFHLGLDSFRLLSPAFQRGALWNVILMIFQSALEIISAMALLPLFYQLTSPGAAPDSLILNKLIAFSLSFAWSTLVLSVVLLFLVKNLAGLWMAHYQNRYIKRVAVGLTEELYRRFYQQEWIDYVQTNSGETARRIRITPADFANNVVQCYLLFAADALVCLFMMSLMAYLDINIALVIVALGASLIVAFTFLRRTVFAEADRSFRDLNPKSSIRLSQGVDSFAEVKIYNKEDYFVNRFMALRTVTADYLRKLKTLTTVPGRIFEVIGVLCLASTILYAKAFPERSGGLELAIGLVSIAVYRIMPALNRMLVNVVQIRTYGYSVAELHDSFQKKAVKEPLQPDIIKFNDTLRFRDVSFQYSESSAPLFQKLDLSVKKGDFIVLEGPSGAGKTTLLHMLAGLLPTYKGQIMIDDTALSPSTLRDWQDKLGFVPQSPVVLEDTLLKNVAFGEEVPDRTKAIKALEWALLGDFVNASPDGLDTNVGENGLTLSGGQRQRLVMARAFYRNPQVYLLDEVTNQLDEDNKIRLLSNLKKLTGDGNIVVLISHDSIAKPFATAVHRLEDGVLRQV